MRRQALLVPALTALVALPASAAASVGIPKITAARFAVTAVIGQSTDWTYHDYNPDPNCGGTSDGNGTEDVAVVSGHAHKATPFVLTALQFGHQLPVFLVGKGAPTIKASGELALQGTQTFQMNPGGTGCANGEGGAPPPPPDCGTKVFYSLLNFDVGTSEGATLVDVGLAGFDPFEQPGLFQNCVDSGQHRLVPVEFVLSHKKIFGHTHLFKVKGKRRMVDDFGGYHRDTFESWTFRFKRLKPPKSPASLLSP